MLMWKNGFNIHWKKFHFLASSVEYLGFIIKNSKITPSPTKIKALLNLAEPKTVRFGKFFRISGYGYETIAAPIHKFKHDSKHVIFKGHKISFF